MILRIAREPAMGSPLGEWRVRKGGGVRTSVRQIHLVSDPYRECEKTLRYTGEHLCSQDEGLWL